MISEDAEFDTEFPERGTDEPALVIDVEGFEGPLDLLLMLARQQKVDLAKISILALADQYLAFIEEAIDAHGAHVHIADLGPAKELVVEVESAFEVGCV